MNEIGHFIACRFYSKSPYEDPFDMPEFLEDNK